MPDSSYKHVTGSVLTINKLKKSIKFKEVEVIDISLIYLRVTTPQLTNEALEFENVFSFELYPVLTFKKSLYQVSVT